MKGSMTQIQAPALAPAAEAEQPAVNAARIGVLLVNLGTPEGTDFWSMRRYLKEFLSDKRVIEQDSLLWKLVFNVGILTLRPKFKGRDYDKIWNREKNESPFKTITRAQGEKLAAKLASVDPRIVTDWAMRYGQPSIASRLAALTAQGCDRILILPLYPQYAAATTATVGDEVFRVLMTMRRQPSVRFVPPYYNDPVYIEALGSSMAAELAKLPWQPDVILASFHGIPKEYVDKGDPYQAQCIETMRLLRESLGLDEESLMLTFQSRFGRTEWIRPYTDETVKQLAQNGVKNLAVITPGFSADCLETLEEIAVENAEIFKENGGSNFFAIPCLNDSELGMNVISQLALRELQGWL
jgi:protoporphyrin/coproporphyrin ferrochelatase